MKPRLLVLTAGYGEGHNAAARALVAACDAAHGPGAAELVDLFEVAKPRFNTVTRRAYLATINGAPRLWRHVYAWMDRSRLLPRLIAGLGPERRSLEAVLERVRPTAICSTFPAYAYLLEKIARNRVMNTPNFNIVTDSISVNSIWWRAACEGWFLPNEDSAEVMRRAGIEPERLHVNGFPVASFFSAHHGRLAPPDLAAGAAPRVLYIINSGTRHALETARMLLAETEWEITCAVGRDEALRAALTRLAEGRARPTAILGWTDQIPRLLMTHHVVVSKAGGATTQEAIAAQCPMIVNQVVPGQEEGNYELLRRHGVGGLAETPTAVVAELRRGFAHGGLVWRGWREAVGPLSRPDAARDIVAKVLALVEQRGEPVPLPLQGGRATPPTPCVVA